MADVAAAAVPAVAAETPAFCSVGEASEKARPVDRSRSLQRSRAVGWVTERSLKGVSSPTEARTRLQKAGFGSITSLVNFPPRLITPTAAVCPEPVTARRILRRSGRAPLWESLRGPVRRPFLAYPPFPGRGGSLWTPDRGSEASLPQRNTYMPRTEGLQPGPHVNHPCARRRLWERYFVYYVYSRTRRSVGLLSALSVITDVRRAVESKFGRRGVA